MATVYPVVPGAPEYGTGSTSQYIPAIYSALLVKKFYPKTVFGKISQTDYEGDIKEQGDTVYIRTRATIETFRYKKGMVLPVQNPESPFITLKVDQGEGFSVALDKVDEKQADVKLLNVWGEDASEQMKQVLDRNVLTTIAAQGALAGGKTKAGITGYTANAGADLSGYTIANGALVSGGTTVKGTSITATKVAGDGSLGLCDAGMLCDTSAKIVSQVLALGGMLDENNAPEEGRFIVLPSIFMQKLKDISAPFGQAYATGQNSANIVTGSVPKIDRFDVIFSNNVPNSATALNYPIIFGCKYATTFATQITESRIIDNPFAFGKMMQGLQVYGFQVIKPQLLGVDFWKNAAS